MTPFRILAISGSLRARSSNLEILLAAALLDRAAFEVRVYSDLGTLPHFNPDLDLEGATLPPSVAALRAQIAAADALLISSPEYAHGVPGTMKNALDWLVSGPEMVGKRVGLLTASTRSTFAPASLVETLRTMSAAVVDDAVRVVPMDGRKLDAQAILADVLGETLRALRAYN